mmetsp:Transcript_10139/g.16920  ORF Transcript_10139/g.16920 Transcript_10139/m.16920 type:complete len:205 (-) Transcript_10139:2493-3107(-)
MSTGATIAPALMPLFTPSAPAPPTPCAAVASKAPPNAGSFGSIPLSRSPPVTPSSSSTCGEVFGGCCCCCCCWRCSSCEEGVRQAKLNFRPLPLAIPPPPAFPPPPDICRRNPPPAEERVRMNPLAPPPPLVLLLGFGDKRPFSLFWMLSGTILLMPKSVTFTTQWSSTTRLEDFRSRWQIGGWCECRYSMPRAAWSAHVSTSS